MSYKTLAVWSTLREPRNVCQHSSYIARLRSFDSTPSHPFLLLPILDLQNFKLERNTYHERHVN